MKFSMLFVYCLSASTTVALGQINCSQTPNVTQPLVCLVPYNVALNDNIATRILPAIRALTLPINGSIAAQLTQLPVPSAGSGTIILHEKGKLLGGGAFDDLGPVLTQRPETIGARHLYAGFTYQRFNFNALDGNAIGSLQFGFAVPTGTPDGTYYGSSNASINFKLDQYVALVTYGATTTTDLSVVVPFNSVSVTSESSNVRVYEYTPGGSIQALNDTAPIATNSGSANGVGDIKFGVKQQIFGGDTKPLAVAAGLGLRIPSGDAQNFLGSGAYGFDIYGLVSYRSSTSPLSPHFKIGKQWNGPTVLLNPSGNGNTKLPGGIQYEAGTDIRVIHRKVTLSLDVIGNQFTNAPTLSSHTLVVDPKTFGSSLPALYADLPTTNTYTKINFSSGLKYAPFKDTKFIVYGNVLVQLNNVGLRSDPVPLVGVSYNFGKDAKE